MQNKNEIDLRSNFDEDDATPQPVSFADEEDAMDLGSYDGAQKDLDDAGMGYAEEENEPSDAGLTADHASFDDDEEDYLDEDMSDPDDYGSFDDDEM